MSDFASLPKFFASVATAIVSSLISLTPIGQSDALQLYASENTSSMRFTTGDDAKEVSAYRAGQSPIQRRRVAFIFSGQARADSIHGVIQKVQLSINVTPDTVDTGTAANVTISASGLFDLSQVRASQIGMRPGDGITNLQIIAQTAQHLTLSFQIAETASTGTRTLFIKDNNGQTVVALDLMLKMGPDVCIPHCVSPQTCRNNICVSPPPPPHRCDPECGPGEVCKNGVCVGTCPGGKRCP